MNNGGDVLARGARSATFPPAKVTQAKWDAIFGGPDEIEVPKKKKKAQKNKEE
jgi:hypothetical protein